MPTVDLAKYIEGIQQDLPTDQAQETVNEVLAALVDESPLTHETVIRQLSQKTGQGLTTLKAQLKWMIGQHKKAQEAKEVEQPKPERDGPELTDLGNSIRLHAFLTRDGSPMCRWDEASEQYLLYQDGRWQRQKGTSLVRRAASKMVEQELSKAREQGDPELIAHWKQAQSKRALDAMVDLYRDRAGVIVPKHAKVWDQHPWLVNFRNGTLDLKTHERREHDAADMLTQMIEHDYDPDAKCPTWDRFLETSVPDPEIRCWIQRRDGSGLTGSTRDQILDVHHGPKGGGKSTHLDTLADIAPDYIRKLARSVFEQTRNEQHPTDKMDAAGKRRIYGDEIDHRLAVNQIKDLTGSGVTKARNMGKDFVDLTPTWDVSIITNKQPKVPDTEVTDGIWDRVRVIPWTQQFRGTARQDKNLREKLRAEAAGILAWCVRGCYEWLEHGLPKVAAIEVATKEVQEANNSVQLFLDERCAGSSPGGDCVVLAQTLWELRQAYNEALNERTHETQTGFGLQLKALGYQHGPQDKNGRRTWKGIQISTSTRPTAEQLIADAEEHAEAMDRLMSDTGVPEPVAQVSTTDDQLTPAEWRAAFEGRLIDRMGALAALAARMAD